MNIVSNQPGDMVVMASRNKGKTRELAALMNHRFQLITLDEIGWEGEIAEDGDTFRENARQKAEEVCRRLRLPALADDSGLEVDALDGAPGVYSARYAGRHGDDAANNRLLLERLEGATAPRLAKFVCSLAFARPDRETIIVSGECAGEIGFAAAGEGGFGYDPLFYRDGVSFAQMDESEKNRVSHRAVACRAMLDALEHEAKHEAKAEGIN
jgi:XTP/dITP diphosphohydrolase